MLERILSKDPLPGVRRSCMRECPIEFSSLSVQRAKGQASVTDPRDRNHLGIISGRENLVCLLEILVAKSLLDHINATLAQQPDYPLAGNAREESTIRNRREHNSVFRHEHVRSGQFSDVPQHVADNGVVKAARMRFKK